MVAAIARHRFLNTEQVCKLFACDCPETEVLKPHNGKMLSTFVKTHRENCACSCAAKRGGEHAASCRNLFKNNKHVASRLLELFQAGYLERPIVQLQLRVKDGRVAPGSVPMVYCVTKEGLDLIGSERRGRLGPGKQSWVSKVNEGGRVFMEHTLAVADVSIGVDLAMRQAPEFERLSEEQLMSGMKSERKASVSPFGFNVKYKSTKLSAVCDLAFAIGHIAERKRWNFLVEVDMGHMPVERAGLSKSSILRKLVAYSKAFEDGQHREEFDWRGFRVLVLTTSEARVDSCVKACMEQFGTSSATRMFLFGTLDAVKNLLDYKFKDGRGREVGLIG
jgi:hypothetical protein